MVFPPKKIENSYDCESLFKGIVYRRGFPDEEASPPVVPVYGTKLYVITPDTFTG
jgi:hypothetical protein